MAGGFGGDDEDFDQYENDEEELEEELELQETPNEEDESEDSDIGNDEEDSIELNPIKRYQEEEKKLEESLNNIEETLEGRNPKDIRFIPRLKQEEKDDLKEAGKHPKLYRKVLDVFKTLWSKIWGFISTNSTWIVPLVGILLAILVGLPIVASVLTWATQFLLWPDDDSAGPGGSGGGGSAAFGVTGDDFYGVRTIYTDDEKARIGLLEEYSTIIDNSIEQTLTIEKLKTITTGSGDDEVSKTYKVSVVIDLTIPKTEMEGEEPTDFNYSTFNEETFKSNYIENYTILNSVAEKVYVYDNPTGNIPSSLIEKLDNINYFGLDATVSAEVKTLIYNKLVELYDIEVFNQTDNMVEEGAIKNQLKSELKSEIETEINSEVAEVLAPYTARTEKLFVKDFILSESDEMMSGITEENYVCWIFMPNKAVQFEQVWLYITHKDIDNFNIKLFNNGSEIAMKKDEEDLGNENTKLYSYFAKNLSENVGEFEDIDISKIDALKQGVALSDIIKDVNLPTEKYLSLNAEGVYTFNKNGLYVEFNSLEKFYCVEMETLWGARSN